MVQEMMRSAITTATIHQPDVPMPYDQYVWDSEEIDYLIVLPQESEEPVLTWGIWTNALIGINRFRLAYPGLDFDFVIHIMPGEVYVGNGHLFDIHQWPDLRRVGGLAMSAKPRVVESSR